MADHDNCASLQSVDTFGKGGNDISLQPLMWLGTNSRMDGKLYIDVENPWNPEKCAAGHHIHGSRGCEVC